MSSSRPAPRTPGAARQPLILQPLALAALLCVAQVAQAQAPAASSPAQPSGTVLVAAADAPLLKEMVVSGSRYEQDPDELPMSIDVINARQMEEQQMRDIRDIARDMPNVSVKRAPARFTLASSPTGRDQNSGFNIRGLDGNRVLMLVDGIRLPRSYVFSANAFGRDYLDVGMIQRVEVVRGATSALYGSDGMAGLVNFITNEPSNLLKNGQTFGGRASVGYDSESTGKNLGLTLAGKPNETVEWLLGVNLGRSRELKNMGDIDTLDTRRTVPNPQHDKDASVLGKVVVRPNADQKHTFTVEHVDKKADYQLYTARTAPPVTAAAAVIDSGATTDMKRSRGSWAGEWRNLSAPVFDDIKASLSYQNADSREFIYEDRLTAADRTRDVTYQEKTWQANVQASKLLRSDAGLAQKITYGIDYVRSDVENLQTGITPPVGETFPLKRFPDTTESSWALYAQDELVLGNWTFTPGLRYDHFSIKADQAGFGANAVSLSGNATSPKLGVMYRVNPEWSVFGNYAKGFRAPNAGQVNAFFENPVANYKTIPNPDLKPETSQNLELGVRGRLGNVALDVAAFTGRYKDFIDDLVQVGGVGSPSNPLVFQSVNRGRVNISGFEVKGHADWGRYAGIGWSTPFSWGRTQGRDRTSAEPLSSIDPQRFTVGLRADAAAWTAQLGLNYTQGKKAKDTTNPSTGAQFLSPSATVVDLTTQWRIRKDLRLNVGLYNLTDKKYWRWADVRGVASNAAFIDGYTQPGRSLKVSLVAEF
ncbi:TonB-dependent hemoglobin/transferrin/lactoferrin family receptor [Comamonas piscis]|uniref:TonB-dependent hemoglobin/transferrin/lactoferrin family receptor n=1 Tax=Comamonas piscis TaxID=1562974 RepID=A0A7G5EP77_9BURK|nr:TonB-dependent hemoglobin/transferrin/lactoferrin family receptor [Comamonas piscis]